MYTPLYRLERLCQTEKNLNFLHQPKKNEQKYGHVKRKQKYKINKQNEDFCVK